MKCQFGQTCLVHLQLNKEEPAPPLFKQGIKNHLTVYLYVKANGTKLKPYVVIPAKKAKKELEVIPEVAVAGSPNGWMNEELTADWIEKIWTNFLLLNECLFGILLGVTFLM